MPFIYLFTQAEVVYSLENRAVTAEDAMDDLEARATTAEETLAELQEAVDQLRLEAAQKAQVCVVD